MKNRRRRCHPPLRRFTGLFLIVGGIWLLWLVFSAALVGDNPELLATWPEMKTKKPDPP